jgi:queuine tRNA-ribosyltransferase
MNTFTDTDSRLKFSVDAEALDSSARACTFKTLHNTVKTPVFMPVATTASLRTQSLDSAREIGFPVLLSNTYHLLLRPGTEVFEKMGGIHRFMNWNRSILTDSGGFQIFSLSESFAVSSEGARVKSYVDGKEFLLSPESSIETQKIIGSDIMMALDQCISSKSAENECLESIDITARWAQRSLAARGDSPQSMFGIIQGACFPDLRKISARQITSLPFDGYAIGGLAVGESADQRKDLTELTAQLMPKSRPRYLMGVGTPIDLLEAVHRGVDMFDCIIPIAMAQRGNAYTSAGKIELRRGVYKFADVPLDENCDCLACRRYSRAYLHHLVKTNEFSGASLIGQHNLKFYFRLMNDMRSHIIHGDFRSFYDRKKEELILCDEENPKTVPSKRRRKNTRVLGNYEVVQHKDGFHSIRDKVSGETMHSVTDPMVESRLLYVDQSDLRNQLSKEAGGPLVIWDVGLGAGTNAMAAISEIESLRKQTGASRGVRLFSFENDLDSLRLTLKSPSLFPHVKHPAPASIAKNGSWESSVSGIEWTLLTGDFALNFEKTPAPDIIYYDMFSLNFNDSLWSMRLFKRIFDHCNGKDARLITYTVSTRIRSALLAAGFFVCYGTGTGPKTETTIAFTSYDDARTHSRPVGTEWLGKWERSTAKVDGNLSEEEKESINQKVKNHKQFAKLT